MHDDARPLRERLNLETGRLTWPEIQRHFARGAVVRVKEDLDLVEVAACMATDDREQFMPWFASGQVVRASVEDAADWDRRQTEFWGVVVAPWLLVQEIAPSQQV